VVLLLAAILENARTLIQQGMHPSVICEKLIHESLFISDHLKDFSKECSFTSCSNTRDVTDEPTLRAQALVESVLSTKVPIQQAKVAS
jgi:chaperonin GroEL (HSP60 family)